MAAQNAAVPSHLASNPFEDLSGISTSAFSNPYDALIHASNDNVVSTTPQTSAYDY
jgi:hypothetical protein